VTHAILDDHLLRDLLADDTGPDLQNLLSTAPAGNDEPLSLSTLPERRLGARGAAHRQLVS
jgi:hypothetical protein